MDNKKIKDEIYEICRYYKKESIDIEEKIIFELVYRTTQIDLENNESSFQSDLNKIKEKYNIEIKMKDISK